MRVGNVKSSAGKGWGTEIWGKGKLERVGETDIALWQVYTRSSVVLVTQAWFPGWEQAHT